MKWNREYILHNQSSLRIPDIKLNCIITVNTNLLILLILLILWIFLPYSFMWIFGWRRMSGWLSVWQAVRRTCSLVGRLAWQVNQKRITSGEKKRMKRRRQGLGQARSLPHGEKSRVTSPFPCDCPNLNAIPCHCPSGCRPLRSTPVPSSTPGARGVVPPPPPHPVPPVPLPTAHALPVTPLAPCSTVLPNGCPPGCSPWRPPAAKYNQRVDPRAEQLVASPARK